MMTNASPTLAGDQISSFSYAQMARGTTRPILLIGHADTIDNTRFIKDIIQVHSINEILRLLLNDIQSPLVQGILEAYNAGCRDIFIMPVAPMSEYRQDVDVRNEMDPDLGSNEGGAYTFYEKYYQDLEQAYALLEDKDFFEIIVPIEAPYFDTGGVDFAMQLNNFCSRLFELTSKVAIGVLGTRMPRTTFQPEAEVGYGKLKLQEMVGHRDINVFGPQGKFVSVAVGEGIIINPQSTFSFPRSLEVVFAALLSTTDYKRSIAGIRIPYLVSLSHNNFTKEEIELLSMAKLNPITKSAIGARGRPFECYFATDNTLCSEDSDFYSLYQMSVIALAANTLRFYSRSFLGTNMHYEFKKTCQDYMRKLKTANIIVDYWMKIEIQRDGKAYIDVEIEPMFGLKHLYFSITSGVI